MIRFSTRGEYGMRLMVDLATLTGLARGADMNALLLGIEAGNNGVGEWWSDEMTTIYAQTVAALCVWYGWSLDAVYLHATTGPPSGGCNSKIDPAGPWQGEPDNGSTWSLDTWRQFVNDYGAPSQPEPEPEPIPEPIPEDEDEMPAFLIANPNDGGVYVSDMVTYKTHVPDPALMSEGCALFGWKSADGAGAPWMLGPGWGVFVDALPTSE